MQHKQELVYYASQSTVVPASGIATLTFAGPNSNYKRSLSNVVINCTASTPRPICKMYRGYIAANTLMATSQIGYADTFIRDDSDRDLMTGENIILQWTNAAVGSTVTGNPNGIDYA